MTVFVIAELTPLKDVADSLWEAVVMLSAASRLEQGCLSYRPLIDPDKPDTVVILEEWETQAALDAHGQTVDMKLFKEKISGVDVQVTKYQV